MKLKDQNGNLVAVKYQGSIYGQAGQGEFRDITQSLLDGTIEELDNGLITDLNRYMLARTSIRKINLPNCSRVITQALVACRQLSEAYLNECLSLGYQALAHCSALETLSLPKCTFLSAEALAYCSKLPRISLPECTLLSKSAIYDCGSVLSSVSIPKCSIISDYALYGNGLIGIDAPKCQQIGNSAFDYCSRMSYASLPLCSNIKSYAFGHCYRLTDIYVGGSLSSIASNALSSTPFAGYSRYASKPATLWCPESKAEEYRTKFGSIFSIISTY